MLEQLKQQEIRAALAVKYPTELELQAEYQTWASEGGSDHLMRAVEESPLPLLDRTIIEEGRRTRALRESPGSTELLAGLRRARGQLAARLETLRAEIGADFPGPDPIAQMAEGVTNKA